MTSKVNNGRRNFCNVCGHKSALFAQFAKTPIRIIINLTYYLAVCQYQPPINLIFSKIKIYQQWYDCIVFMFIFAT